VIIPGSAPTWELVVDSRARGILDNILASLFYLKSGFGCNEAAKDWRERGERVGYQAAYSVTY
jgi:hypothetical protein